MKELIEHMLIEDPNLRFEINEDSGEFLLSGVGSLHLEVTANEIGKRGVNVSISEPRAVFKESCRYDSSLIKASSSTSTNLLNLKVERLDEKTVRFFQNIDYKTIKPFNVLKEVLQKETNLNEEEIENFWICDEDQNIIIFNANSDSKDLYRNEIVEIIEKIHLNGPLCGEKLSEIKITIEDLNLNQDSQEQAFTELSTMLYDAIRKSLTKAELVLLEPIYHTIIQLPPEYIKNTITLLSKYSAKIKTIDQDKEYQAVMEILIPVRHSIKFAEEIRSISSGRAFWQNEFYAFMEVPEHESQKLIKEIKFLKGISW
jgi:elongation factor 2